MAKTVKIKLVKSPIGYSKKIRETVKALGLKKMGMTIEKELNPAVEGMINKVSFMLNVE